MEDKRGLGGEGMTLRDRLAAAALTGILSNTAWSTTSLVTLGIAVDRAVAHVGTLAYLYADAALAARDRPKEGGAPCT